MGLEIKYSCRLEPQQGSSKREEVMRDQGGGGDASRGGEVESS